MTTLSTLLVSLIWLAPAPPPDDRPADRAERPCVPGAPGERFEVDFRDTPVGDVARLVSCAAERNIVFDPTHLSGKPITVYAARTVSLRDLLTLWGAALRQHGLTVERSGGFDIVKPADP